MDIRKDMDHMEYMVMEEAMGLMKIQDHMVAMVILDLMQAMVMEDTVSDIMTTVTLMAVMEHMQDINPTTSRLLIERILPNYS